MGRPHWHGRKFNPLQIAGMAILGVISVVLFAFVFGLFVRMLWNWLMPDIFGLGKITYWQGFGLCLLGRLLFGSISAGRYDRGRKHWRHHDRHCCWEEEDSKIQGSWRNWDHYDGWWHAEGKAAFESYVEKVHNGEDGGEKETES